MSSAVVSVEPGTAGDDVPPVERKLSPGTAAAVVSVSGVVIGQQPPSAPASARQDVNGQGSGVGPPQLPGTIEEEEPRGTAGSDAAQRPSPHPLQQQQQQPSELPGYIAGNEAGTGASSAGTGTGVAATPALTIAVSRPVVSPRLQAALSAASPGPEHSHSTPRLASLDSGGVGIAGGLATPNPGLINRSEYSVLEEAGGPPGSAAPGDNYPGQSPDLASPATMQLLSEQKLIRRPPPKIRCDTGHFSMQGVRNEMEDKVTVLPHPEFNRVCGLPDDEARHFFAVFDGHGGDVSAEYCHLHMHMNLVKEPLFGKDPIEALKLAVLRTDNDFCSACRRIHLLTSSGTTAIVAYIENDFLVVANVGDSRAVLCRNNKAVALSIDHKPGRPDEKQRVELLGGRVATTEEEALGLRKPSTCCSCLRQCLLPKRPLRVFPGGLSVSRTIGDISLKATKLIIADPELYACQLIAEDTFIVLACDGVWDVMNNQQAVDCVRKNLHEGPEAASKALAREAYRRGSTDNISVVVVVLHRLDGQTRRLQSISGQGTPSAGGSLAFPSAVGGPSASFPRHDQP